MAFIAVCTPDLKVSKPDLALSIAVLIFGKTVLDRKFTTVEIVVEIPCQTGLTTLFQRKVKIGARTFEMNAHSPMSAGFMTHSQAVWIAAPMSRKTGCTTLAHRNWMIGTSTPVMNDHIADRAGEMILAQAEAMKLETADHTG